MSRAEKIAKMATRTANQAKEAAATSKKKIRGKNNVNWMDLLRLAYKKSPKESATIMSKIYRDDSKISKLVKKLIR